MMIKKMCYMYDHWRSLVLLGHMQYFGNHLEIQYDQESVEKAILNLSGTFLAELRINKH